MHPSPQPGIAVPLQQDPNCLKNKVNCGECLTTNFYSPTDCSDIVIKCSNKNCRYFICTLEKCFKSFLTRSKATRHHNYHHRKNADVNKCHFCKASKIRDGVKTSSKCPNCGILWCLVGNCTFESLTGFAFTKHELSHNK